MHELTLFFSMVLLLSLAQNIVLLGGAGTGHLIGRDFRPRDILVHGMFITVYSLLVIVAFEILEQIGLVTQLSYKILTVAALMVIFYLASVLFIKLFRNPKDNNFYKISALACFNAAVFLLPFIRDLHSLGLVPGLGAALGAGIGVVLTEFICKIGFNRLQHPDVPKAFQGIPGRFLYVGILSMAVAGFAMKELMV